MILSPLRAHGLCVAAFARTGMPRHEAGQVADVLVEAELWGKPTHGLSRVHGLAQRYEAKRRTGTLSPITTVKEGPAYLHLDAGSNFGYVALRQALDQAVAKATQAGVCVAGIRNSDHCGVAGYYAWLAATRGFISGLTCDCFPRTAPYGATSPVFGTNPIACGLPTEPDPVVLDFSVAEMTNGMMSALAQAGRTLGDRVGFDADGQPTTNPERCLAGSVRAFGGHKGSGIALVAQMLCTAFVGAAAMPDKAVDYGYFLVVIKPDLFVPMDEFHRRAGELTAAVKAARPEREDQPVLLPGERSAQAKRRAMEHGIEAPDDVVAALERIAQPSA